MLKGLVGPRARKALLGGLIFLVLFAITGFFVLPPVIKSLLVKNLGKQLHREVVIREVKVNPFILSVEVRDFLIRERGGREPFISLGRVYANLQSMSIFKNGIILSEVGIENPYINVVRNEDMTYNFSDLLKEMEAKPASGSKPLKFSLNNIRISGGRIDFSDRPKQKKHKLADMKISVPFVSNMTYYTDIYVQPSFEAMINDHPVSFAGKTKPFKDSRETSVEVNVKNFNIPYYLAYLPLKMRAKVLSGSIDAQTTVFYTQYRDRPPSLNVKGEVAFKDIKVADEQDNRLLSLPLIGLSLSSTDLVTGKINLSSIDVQSPEIDLTRDKRGRWNVNALFPETPEKKKEEEKAAKNNDKKAPGFTINVDAITLTKGKISFSDLQDRAFRTSLENIEAKIEHFSNARDLKANAALSFTTEAAESFRYEGEFGIEPPSSLGTVEAKGIKLKKYSSYYPKDLLFDVEKGELELLTRYSIAKNDKDFEIKLSGLSSLLSSLTLKKRDEKEDFLSIPALAVKETDIDLLKKEVLIGTLSTQKGIIKIKRLRDGGVNVASLISPSEKAPAKAAPHEKKKIEKPWRLTLKKIEADGYMVKMEDRLPAEPVILSATQIRLRGENISTVPHSKGRAALSFRTGKKGTFSSQGTLGIDPAGLRMKVNIKDLDIISLQPYIADKVKIIITDGGFSAGGDLNAGYTKEGGPKVAYKGEAHVSHFASVDKANADDFLKWDSLYFKGMSIGYNPLSVNIDEVSLTDFYSKIVINEDGSLNVQGIVQEDTSKKPDEAAVKKQPAAPPPKEAAAKQVKIDRVTLQGGTIDFSDMHIKPHYAANMEEIGGRISGLSSEENIFADVDLKGKVEDAPMEITGKINPLREDLYVDLKADLKEMDLSSLTPYSGRYAGYTIQKGQLSLTMQYLIVKKKLDSQNNVFLDQFTFGEKVESPDATKLPVKFAVALLKNRKGEIKLDIPVTGYIDDPKFSVGRIILKIILNLLAKAATSPFALLGALFGGGEELGYLEYDYGSSVIQEQGAKKLDTLIKALHERPSLKLDIEGHADVGKDRDGLRQYLFDKKLKAQKLKEMLKKGMAPVSVDEVQVEKAEYPKYLKAAYKAEKFPKPRNLIGIAKDLPVPEMEKLMLTHIEVKDDDLKLLASERARNVKEYLLKSQKIEQDRIFLVEAKTLQPEKKEKVKDSRVDFRLK